jgi:hypothetical protein
MQKKEKMDKKKTIDAIFEILAFEARKIKKKKKFSPVAVAPIRRPMGSMFYMDAAVSVPDIVSEAASVPGNIAIKGVPKKFDNLKWKLNDYQKSFLDEFISIPSENLREEDYKYASKFTGIPLTNIKSIQNTYADKNINSYHKQDVIKGSKFDVGHKGPTAIEIGLGNTSTLPKRSDKTATMNQDPKFRGKSLGELNFNDGSTINRVHERDLPEFMYEWVMYFIEGSEKFKIHETKVMEHSFVEKRKKAIVVEMNSEEKITDGFLDFASGRKLKETLQLEELLKDFNANFETNFIIETQFTNKKGNLVIVIENNQTTDGKKVVNKKKIDMAFTDEKRQAAFNAAKAMCD